MMARTRAAQTQSAPMHSPTHSPTHSLNPQEMQSISVPPENTIEHGDSTHWSLPASPLPLPSSSSLSHHQLLHLHHHHHLSAFSPPSQPPVSSSSCTHVFSTLSELQSTPLSPPEMPLTAMYSTFYIRFSLSLSLSLSASVQPPLTRLVAEDKK